MNDVQTCKVCKVLFSFEFFLDKSYLPYIKEDFMNVIMNLIYFVVLIFLVYEIRCVIDRRRSCFRTLTVEIVENS